MSEKLMAIDYGSKRVGIASTDDSGHFSLPRMVLDNDKDLLSKVPKFKDDEKISKIIIGKSTNFSGQNNPIQDDIDKFKNELEKRGVEIILHTEILSTVEARQIQGQTQMTDASAAAIILKSFIDTHV